MPHANVETRVALITGAGSGIGLACALALDAAGVNVMLQGIDRLQLERASSLLSRQPLCTARLELCGACLAALHTPERA